MGRLKRIRERWQHEIEKESKEFVIREMMNARSNTFSLQNTQDVPPLPSEQKKKPNEHKVKKARDAMLDAQERWMKAISHPYYFEAEMGLGHNFEPPTEPEAATSEEFREQRRVEAAAREQRFSASLRAVAEASGNQFIEEPPTGE